MCAADCDGLSRQFWRQWPNVEAPCLPRDLLLHPSSTSRQRRGSIPAPTPRRPPPPVSVLTAILSRGAGVSSTLGSQEGQLPWPGQRLGRRPLGYLTPTDLPQPRTPCTHTPSPPGRDQQAPGLDAPPFPASQPASPRWNVHVSRTGVHLSPSVSLGTPISTFP